MMGRGMMGRGRDGSVFSQPARTTLARSCSDTHPPETFPGSPWGVFFRPVREASTGIR